MSVLYGRSEAQGGSSRNAYVSVFQRLLKVRLAGPSLAIVLLVIVLAVFAPLIAPYDPLEENVRNRLESPTIAHPFGTDPIGRDVLSRIVYGSRVSLSVGIVSVVVAMAIGVPLGLVSGYVGGVFDELAMRIVDAIVAFPAIVLALVFMAAFGPSLMNVMLAIGIISVPVYSRLVRAQVLSLREQEFIAAAHALGASPARIVARHLFPNTLAPVIVAATLGMSFAILAEAALSFLGIGVQPPTPTWGGMLNEAFKFIYDSSYLSIIPGIAIFLLVLALNFLGDALRDALDPRSARALQADSRR